MVELLSTDNDFVLIEGHKEATQYPQILLLKPGEDPTNVAHTPLLKQVVSLMEQPLTY